jgi:hypothetical protein
LIILKPVTAKCEILIYSLYAMEHKTATSWHWPPDALESEGGTFL